MNLLDRLHNVKPKSNGRYVAACPAHEDQDPSLAIAVLDDGRILVKCFAGCSAADVVAAVGMSLSDLFPDGAIREQMRGWQQMTHKDNGTDKTVLAMAESDRKRGVKLSPQDLHREREAYLRLRNENPA